MTAKSLSRTLNGMFRIGTGAGFSGHRIDAPGPVVGALIARGFEPCLNTHPCPVGR